MSVPIYCLCEGYSEMNFVKRMLAPHLGEMGVEIHAPMVTTSRNSRTGQQFKGGGRGFANWETDLRNLWAQHGRRGAHLTTFVDLYALPSGFPGHDETAAGMRFRDRANHIEAAFTTWAKSNGIERFVPYLAIHEFETMVFADLEALGTLFLEHSTAIHALRNEVASFADVEEINSTPEGAPSKRIGKHISTYPRYKRSDQSGIVNVLEVIGLLEIRAACHHFDLWLSWMEGLGKGR